MAEETLLPNADDSGWPTGTFADIDEGVPGDNVAVMSTTTDPDTLTLDFGASLVEDADTVTDITVKITARCVNSGGKDYFDVNVDGLGDARQALSTTFADYTFTNALWNVDRTAAQMDALQVTVTSIQTGKGVSVTYELDSIEVVVTYTEAATGRRRVIVC